MVKLNKSALQDLNNEITRAPKELQNDLALSMANITNVVLQEFNSSDRVVVNNNCLECKE